jgi:hypothetical protein
MKTQHSVLAMATGFLLAMCGPAPAQWFVPDYSYGYGQGAFGIPYPVGYGYGGGTPASFETQAMADLVRAQGQYNEMSGKAMVDYEQARSQYIQNQKDWTEVYAMQQRIRQEQKMQKEQARRERIAKRDSQPPKPANMPTRLMSMQLDRSTGKIAWPEPLEDAAYADNRKSLESLFATRAHTGTTAELADAIKGEVKSLHAELRKHIRDLKTQDYIEARKFLDGLATEGQIPVG